VAQADALPGKAGEILRARLDQVLLNRSLNALITDLDLAAGVDELAVQPWDREAVHTVFDTLQFRTLRDRLFAIAPEGEDALVDARPAPAISVDVLAAGGLGGWLNARTGEPLGLDVQGTGTPAGG